MMQNFIFKAKNTHSNKYDYSLVEYKNSQTKIKIICDTHGVFEQKPNVHLRGSGCPRCICRKITTQAFIDLAQKIHGNKYDYSLVEYKNAKTKLKIICSIHGIFEQNSDHHLYQKAGCNKCGFITAGKKTSFNVEKFLKEAEAVHKNKYDYSKVNYVNTDTKVKIICPSHGEFEQTPYKHLKRKQNCPKCNTSLGEQDVRFYLHKHNLRFEEQKKFNTCKNIKLLPFDFYLYDLNVLIEYQGVQHFKPTRFNNSCTFEQAYNNLKKVQQNDQIKREWCENNNIKLITIHYLDKNNINTILQLHLLA